MSVTLCPPSIFQSPGAVLEKYIAAAAARTAPVDVSSEEGRRIYRALAQQVWAAQQRPVCANDIRDLWQRIDTIKRGAPVHYGIISIHFWAADFANSLAPEVMDVSPDTSQRLAAWLDDWPNICVLGRTGRGKSSTINRLFGVKVAEISHHTACTSTVSDYRLVTGSFLDRPTGVVMWDVPGYGDKRLPWEKYVKLYRRMANKCDVALFMIDNERDLKLDLKMFRKLKKRIRALGSKLVVAVNKSDLFHPCDWDEKAGAPSEEMSQTIIQRASMIAELLDLQDPDRVVPISALKNWNIYRLLNAMVDAAGAGKGASLLRAAHLIKENNPADAEASAEQGRRFGMGSVLRAHFRKAIVGE
jgi:small GTP-binding protein